MQELCEIREKQEKENPPADVVKKIVSTLKQQIKQQEIKLKVHLFFSKNVFH